MPQPGQLPRRNTSRRSLPKDPRGAPSRRRARCRKPSLASVRTGLRRRRLETSMKLESEIRKFPRVGRVLVLPGSPVAR